MKSFLLLILLCVSVKFLNAQVYPTDEKQLKTYIFENSKKYEPIVGIYSITGFIEKYVQGSYINTTPLEIFEKVAILRERDHFVMINISSNGEYSNPTIITPTTSISTYFMGSDNTQISLSSDCSFFKCYYEADENVASAMNISRNQVRNYSVKLKVCSKYTKLFPTQYDIEDYNRVIAEKALKDLKPKSSNGSGFAISNDGLIVTNYHVIENSNSIVVRGINGNFNNRCSANVIMTDKINDLAILKVNDSNCALNTTIPFLLKSNTSEVGESIFVLGFPLTASMGEEIKLTNGIISSKSGFQGDVSTYQITAPIQPGNSGAPLFDKNGSLIGIVSSKHKNTDNVAYAIKSVYLKNLIESLPLKYKLPMKNLLIGVELSGQVKKIKNYVYIIEVTY